MNRGWTRSLEYKTAAIADVQVKNEHTIRMPHMPKYLYMNPSIMYQPLSWAVKVRPSCQL